MLKNSKNHSTTNFFRNFSQSINYWELHNDNQLKSAAGMSCFFHVVAPEKLTASLPLAMPTNQCGRNNNTSLN